MEIDRDAARDRLARILAEMAESGRGQAMLCRGCQQAFSMGEALRGSSACADQRCPLRPVAWTEASAAYSLNVRVIEVAEAIGGMGLLVKSSKPFRCAPVRCSGVALVE